MVLRFIQEELGLELSSRTVVGYLARWGLTDSKRRRNPRALCEPTVRTWLDSKFNELRQAAQQRGAPILWLSNKKSLEGAPWRAVASPGVVFVTRQMSAVRFMVFTGRFNECRAAQLLMALWKESPRLTCLIRPSLEAMKDCNEFTYKGSSRARIVIFPPVRSGEILMQPILSPRETEGKVGKDRQSVEHNEDLNSDFFLPSFWK